MLKILIVDDSEMLGDLFAEFLEAVGFTITGTARSLDEAVASAKASRPDVAVLDYCLGADLGTDFVRRIADDRRPAVLYLSGRPLGPILTSADGEGFVQKPIGLSDLALCVSAVHALRVKEGLERLRIPPGFRPLTGANKEVAPFDNLPAYRRA